MWAVMAFTFAAEDSECWSAAGPLKSALELRLRPREEGGPPPRRVLRVLSGRGGRH